MAALMFSKKLLSSDAPFTRLRSLAASSGAHRAVTQYITILIFLKTWAYLSE